MSDVKSMVQILSPDAEAVDFGELAANTIIMTDHQRNLLPGPIEGMLKGGDDEPIYVYKDGKWVLLTMKKMKELEDD